MKSLVENAHYIEVSAEVRYWEDTSINGVEDGDGTLIPFRDGILWKPVIRLSDGFVLDWPAGVEADVHYKVCDQGQYWLKDADGRRIAKWHGDYVPAHILSQQDRDDDYIICQIGGEGRISGWEAPEIDPDEWDLLLQPESPARFNLKDREGAMPKAGMRKLFEASVRQTPALARHYPLDIAEVDGVFDHYVNDDTDRLWVGFALGLRCAERLSKTQE